MTRPRKPKPTTAGTGATLMVDAIANAADRVLHHKK